MTIHLIELPYNTDTTLNLFNVLHSNPWSMLLYSGHNNTHPEARFDILVTNPSLVLTAQNGTVTILNNENYIIEHKDPFSILKKYTKIFRLQSDSSYPIPFQGGFVGIFGYDLFKYIESYSKLSKPDIHLPDMAIGLYRWAIISDHKLSKNYLVTHDDPNPILNWIYTYHSNYNNQELFQLLTPWKSNIDRSSYNKKFHIIKQHLTLGNCYQICLSQRFQASYTGSDWIAFRQLLRYNQVPFSAFIRLPKQCSILSFSPERFLQLRNSYIKTQPIKGTLPRLKDVQNDQKQIIKLMQSIKNQSENLMIVDLLRNDIGKVAVPGTIYVDKLFDIQSFNQVHHMVSTIIGKLDTNFCACDLLRACFPGGSITGAPKIQAIKLLTKLEPNCRNIWSGSIGYMSCCGNMDTNIAIRTLFTEKNQIYCSVGSGIVFDSHQELEYQEMQHKISTLLTPLMKNFYIKNNNI